MGITDHAEEIVSLANCALGTKALDNYPVKESKPIFLSKSWRDGLCRCEKCLDMYNSKGISFLLDKEDTIMEYEKVAKENREEGLQQQEGVELSLMKNIGHVQKIEILNGIADMKDEICMFLVCLFLLFKILGLILQVNESITGINSARNHLTHPSQSHLLISTKFSRILLRRGDVNNGTSFAEFSLLW